MATLNVGIKIGGGGVINSVQTGAGINTTTTLLTTTAGQTAKVYLRLVATSADPSYTANLAMKVNGVTINQINSGFNASVSVGNGAPFWVIEVPPSSTLAATHTHGTSVALESSAVGTYVLSQNTQ